MAIERANENDYFQNSQLFSRFVDIYWVLTETVIPQEDILYHGITAMRENGRYKTYIDTESNIIFRVRHSFGNERNIMGLLDDKYSLVMRNELMQKKYEEVIAQALAFRNQP